jgi:hypothetical protein
MSTPLRKRIYLGVTCCAGIGVIVFVWFFAGQIRIYYYGRIVSQEERDAFAQSLLSQPHNDAPAECLAFDWSRIAPERITTHRGRKIGRNLVMIEGIRDDGFRIYYLVLQRDANGVWEIYDVWSSIHG